MVIRQAFCMNCGKDVGEIEFDGDGLDAHVMIPDWCDNEECQRNREIMQKTLDAILTYEY